MKINDFKFTFRLYYNLQFVIKNTVIKKSILGLLQNRLKFLTKKMKIKISFKKLKEFDVRKRN